ncbi:MAG: hypothetical protein KatS3mg068_0746 [Candidatus Sericytochromatia bacterium]|nr:MAG: hypothetical protein KatS3mg068_0746 [Candidatus Sericytochromatia bacterium]
MGNIGEFRNLSTAFAEKFKNASSDKIITKQELAELEAIQNQTNDDKKLLELLKSKTDESNFKINIKEGSATVEYNLSIDIDDNSNNNSTEGVSTQNQPTTHEIIPGIITVKDNNSYITDGFEKLDVKAAGLQEEEMNNVKFQGYKQNTEFYSVTKSFYLKQSDLPPGTDVKKLQNYLTVKLGVTNPPIQLKDGKFGPQTLEAFAKVYNQALKEGDTETIEALSPLMNTLATKFKGTKIGETLSKLSQQGASLIDAKAKIESDLNKAVEITSKSKDMTFEEAATQINNLQNIPDNTKLDFMKKIADNKAQEYINKDTLSNKTDAEKLLKACSTDDGKSNGILDEATFYKAKRKSGR